MFCRSHSRSHSLSLSQSLRLTVLKSFGDTYPLLGNA